MTNNNQTQVEKDLQGKKITVTATYNAPPEQVWAAWTESEQLDQWWAPKPWRSETKRMDFREGGHWLYAMVGPEGEKHWARFDFTKITDKKSFEGVDSFTDENGTINTEMPSGIKWHVEFQPSGSGTRVVSTSTFKNEEDLEKTLEMGFEEGFKSGLENLRELLDSQSTAKSR